MSAKKRTSRCMCGQVEVEMGGEPAVMAYCHCASCRGWFNAPVHASTLWLAPSVRVVKGADRLGLFKRTDASLRQFCTNCGTPVLVQHPTIGMVDVPAGAIHGLTFAPTLHVNYGEKVMAVKDGLPKFKDFPEDFGGSGAIDPE